jgi:hypothetical protein
MQNITRPAWAGFKTAEEGRAKICKFLWQKLKNKSNIEQDLLGQVSRLRKREEQIPPLEWVGPEVR